MTISDILVSTEMLAKKRTAKNLVILGGGLIGLECFVRWFGSNCVRTSWAFWAGLKEIAQATKADMEADGATFMLKSSLTKVKGNQLALT